MTPDLIAAWMLGGLAFGLLCVGVQGLRERGRGRRAMADSARVVRIVEASWENEMRRARARWQKRVQEAVAANDRRWMRRILK